MKRLLLLLILLLIPTPAQEYDPFTDRLITYVEAFNDWFLEYRGCPKSFRTNDIGVPINCEGAGSFDLKKWNKTKKAAMKLFNLQEIPER